MDFFDFPKKSPKIFYQEFFEAGKHLFIFYFFEILENFLLLNSALNLKFRSKNFSKIGFVNLILEKFIIFIDKFSNFKLLKSFLSVAVHPCWQRDLEGSCRRADSGRRRKSSGLCLPRRHHRPSALQTTQCHVGTASDTCGGHFLNFKQKIRKYEISLQKLQKFFFRFFFHFGKFCNLTFYLKFFFNFLHFNF